MAILKLTNGYDCIVDDEDYEYLDQWNWARNKYGYAIRHGYNPENDRTHTIYMHRFINKTQAPHYTDHINMNKLDNRKSNLRTVTKSQNSCNKKPQSNNTSGFKGVSWHKLNKRWQAYIKINGKTKGVGSFGDKYSAAHAHDLAAFKCHGEYARPNLACSAFHVGG